MAVSWILSAFILAVVLTTALRTSESKSGPSNLRSVPGPKSWPLLSLLLPKSISRQQLQAWAREYGEVFKVRTGWYDTVYVNEPAAVKEIFDKQSASTSGRAPLPVSADIVSAGRRFVLMSYTPEWRKLRAVVHKLLTPKMSEIFRPTQEFESKQLMYDIYQDSLKGDEEGFYMHIRRYTTSVMLTSTYGRRVPEWNCEDIREVYGLMTDFSDAMGGMFLADIVPPLANIIPPRLQWWRKKALQYQKRQVQIWLKYWNSLRGLISQGQAPECFVKQFIDTEYEKLGIDELQAAFVAGTMIEAGSETTSSILNSVIKYLAKFPEVQKKASDEISRVVGDSRAPTWEDESQLPYLQACAKEILRLRPPNTAGIPHFTTADVVYKDYFIPKGTVVTLNQYALQYDERRYPDPEVFNPDRYLEDKLKAGASAAQADPYQRDHFSFGVGRRICPGIHLAENSFFIVLAKMLWAFELKPPIDVVTGQEEKLDVSDAAYRPGAQTVIKPYKIRFTIRNERRAGIVIRDWEDAKRDGYVLGHVKVTADGVLVA